MMTTASVAYSSVLSMPLNDLDESAAAAQRPGDVDGHPACALDSGDGPELVRRGAGLVPAVLAQVDRDDRLDRPAVPGHDRARRSRRDHAVHAGEALGVGGRLGLVGGGQAGRAASRPRRRGRCSATGSWTAGSGPASTPPWRAARPATSFFSAPVSLLASGPSATTTISQKTRINHLVRRPLGRRMIERAVFIGDPPGSAIRSAAGCPAPAATRGLRYISSAAASKDISRSGAKPPLAASAAPRPWRPYGLGFPQVKVFSASAASWVPSA